VLGHGWDYVRAETDFGVSIEFDGYWVGYVMMPTYLEGMTDGLCGNYNGDASDDLITRYGDLVLNDTNGSWKFGNSWQVDDSEDAG
jgi:hypothetical protein